MGMMDLIRLECVKVPLDATTKDAAIDELSNLLAGTYGLSADLIAAAVKKREEESPTGIGKGLAFPHAKLPTFAQTRMAVGKCKHPIDWKSFDHRAVTLVVLFVSPEFGHISHLDILSFLSTKLGYDPTLDHLNSCNSSQDLFNTLRSIGVDLDVPPGFSLHRFLEDELDVIHSLCWSPEGLYLASAGAGTGHGFRIWDVDNRRIQGLFRGHTAEVMSLAWSGGAGDRIASGAADKTIRIWNVSDCKPERVIDCPAVIHAVAWSHDSQVLAGAGHHSGVWTWEANSGRENPALEGATLLEPAFSVAWSVGDRYLAASGGRINSQVVVWNTASRTIAAILDAAPGPVVSLAWACDGSQLVGGLSDGRLLLWQTGNWSTLPRILRGHSAQVTAVEFAAWANLLASKSDDGTVRLWDTKSWTEVRRLTEHGFRHRLFAPISFSPANQQLATLGGEGNAIRVWKLASHEFARRGGGPAGAPIAIPQALVQAVASRQAVLFAGAGISADCLGVSSEAIRDSVAREIQREHPDYDYSRRSLEEVLAECAALTDQPYVLNKLAQSIPRNVAPSSAHVAAVRAFRHIVTTNWDMLFEDAYKTTGQRWQTIARDEDAVNFMQNENTILKIHGTVEQPITIVATEEQYESYHVTHRQILDRVGELLFTNTVLFVGYAIHEEHMRRLLATIRTLRTPWTKRAYAVGHYDTVRTKWLTEREFTVIDCAADEFLPELARRAGF